MVTSNRKVDRRTLRTRAALLAAFRDLVLSEGYGTVTVDGIIRRAGIGRSTFYLHFSGKRSILECSLDTPCSGLAACVDGDVVPERLTFLLEHFRGQRHLNRVFFEDPIRSVWVGRLASLIEQKLRRHSRPVRARHLLPGSLVALTIAEMQIAMITHWLRNTLAVTPERIAAAILTNTRALLTTSQKPSA